MKQELNITFQHYVPEELIESFTQLGIDKQSEIKIIAKKEDQEYHYYSGVEISDIIIYIQQSPAEVITNGFIIPVAYELLKNGLKFLWAGLSKISIKKLQSSGKEVNQPKNIYVKIINKDKSVEIILDGDANELQANKIIDESFKFINSEKLDDVFQNPDFIQENMKQKTIRLIYNKETQVWEPENFGNYRRQMEEFEKMVKQNLRN